MIERVLFVALLLVLLAPATQAQRLTGVTVEPSPARPGESVTITALFDLSGGSNCAVRMHFGDGQSEDVKINQAKDAVFTIKRRYDKPGSYPIMVEPKTALPTLKCQGDNQRVTLTVTAPVAAAPAASAQPTPVTAKPKGPSCPSGWTLVARSVNKKSGAFDCSAKPGTPAPAGKLECPGSLGYYENSKTGRLGCRP